MKNTKKIEFKPLTPINSNRAEAVNVRRRGDWMEVTGTPAAVCPKPLPMQRPALSAP